MTKAQQVRSMIAQAKALQQTADDLLTQVMTELGFARQLARTYLKNNWDKVEAAVIAAAEAKPQRALSMSKDAIRKRELRAQKRAAAQQIAA